MRGPTVQIDLSEYNELLDIKKKYESWFKYTELYVHHEIGNYSKYRTYSNDEVAPKFSEIEIEREAAHRDCKIEIENILERVSSYNNKGCFYRFLNLLKLDSKTND